MTLDIVDMWLLSPHLPNKDKKKKKTISICLFFQTFYFIFFLQNILRLYPKKKVSVYDAL